MRQSCGPSVVQNGWAVTSSRPRAKSNPMAAAASRPNRSCTSTGNSRVQQRRVRPAAALLDFRHQRHQFLAQPGQHPAHVGRQFLGLVFVQQGVVGALRIPERLGLLALQLDRLFQQRAKRRESRRSSAPLARPAGPSTAVRASSSTNVCGSLISLVVLPLQPTDDHARVALRIGSQRAVGQFLKLLAELRIDPSLVDQPGQQRGSARRDVRPRPAAFACVRPSRARRRWNSIRPCGGRIGKPLDIAASCRRAWLGSCIGRLSNDTADRARGAADFAAIAPRVPLNLAALWP